MMSEIGRSYGVGLGPIVAANNCCQVGMDRNSPIRFRWVKGKGRGWVGWRGRVPLSQRATHRLFLHEAHTLVRSPYRSLLAAFGWDLVASF
jgi:hypothetical protein